MIKLLIILIGIVLYGCTQDHIQKNKINLVAMQEEFKNPPDSVRPWVLWDWISGNVTSEGITHDLESMKKAGIGGVVWREIGGLWWAPEGEAKPYSTKWDSMMQWAIREAERLDIKFSISQDFGYGSGGPHITPENSMQQLVWKDTVVNGGTNVKLKLNIPEIPDDNIAKAWLRPGKKLSDKVLMNIKQSNSYKDIAILAIPCSSEDKIYQIPQLEMRTAMDNETYFKTLQGIPPPLGIEIYLNDILDITKYAEKEGELNWEAPAGKWRIIRIGHASNFLMTRPCPAEAVGLECNRLSRQGIDIHFEQFMKPILEQNRSSAGKTLSYLFLDSWEAGCQNWTQEMADEFEKRRGYKITSWLPVLTGIIVEDATKSERFLWDFRQTANELILDNYLHRLRELIEPYGMKFSVEAYGNLNINTLQFAEMADYPVGEFWTMGNDVFPEIKSHKYYSTMKTMASTAHTTGKIHVGAEAFTGNRGWKDHPYIYKGTGDEAFCRGVNHFFLHLSAHQPYENMIPGLTHQKWGGHFNRFNTWWKYSKPWFDYLARCQYLLKKGVFVADVCYFFGEGAPLDVNDMNLNLPAGYDYDLCSADILQQMEVKKGRVHLPSGMSYQYLLLPDYKYMTLSSMKKIESLVHEGANVIRQKKIIGTPGLEGYPENDKQVKTIADKLWNLKVMQKPDDWLDIFANDQLIPDFQGSGLDYIHRKMNDADIYFVSNPSPDYKETRCTFRVKGKTPGLWDPETGDVMPFSDFTEKNGMISLNLKFNSMQSWFIVFSNKTNPTHDLEEPFHNFKPVLNISGPWVVQFDSSWGRPAEPIVFENLTDWSIMDEQGIKYYSGTAKYRNKFTLKPEQLKAWKNVFLDLGKVNNLAKVIINGKDCGIAWKPPYRVKISETIHAGENIIELEVVNSWVNRMIGDEQQPEDSEWIDWIRLKEWPEWFLRKDSTRPSGRYTFTTVKHYKMNDILQPSGLLGPVNLITSDFPETQQQANSKILN